MRGNVKIDPAPSSSGIVRQAIGDDVISGFGGMRPFAGIRIFDSAGKFTVQQVPADVLTVDKPAKKGGHKLDIIRDDLTAIRKAMQEAGVETHSNINTLITHSGEMRGINKQWQDLRRLAEESYSEDFGRKMSADELGSLKSQFMQELLRGSNLIPSSSANWTAIKKKVADSFGEEVEKPAKIDRGDYLQSDLAIVESQFGAVFALLEDAADELFSEHKEITDGYDTFKDWQYDYVKGQSLTNPRELVKLLGKRNLHDFASILSGLETTSREVKGTTYNVVTLRDSVSYRNFYDKVSSKLKGSLADKLGIDISTGPRPGDTISKIMNKQEKANARQNAEDVLANFRRPNPLEGDDDDLR